MIGKMGSNAFATMVLICLLFLLAFSRSVSVAEAGIETAVWAKYSGNPLNLGDYAASPWVILDGSTYKMWYGSGGDIYYATSSDGISWSIYGIVLQRGASDSWEATLGRPSVILDGVTYKMWYHGYPVEQFARIGYATSSDGISWTKYSGNPVLTPGGNGGWDNWHIHSPSVLKDGSTYRMWYAGQDYQYSPERIGYATSSDGISWTKYGNNPVLTPGGNGGWDDKHVYEHFVLKEGTTYQMYYAGQGSSDIAQIGYATSNDAVSWTKYGGNPVLPVGSAGEWDSFELSMGSLVFDGSVCKMWYQGQDVSLIYSIGLATAPSPTSLKLTPENGFATTTLLGAGFSSTSIVSISWDGSEIPTVPALVTTDSNGKFTAIISVPTQSSPGSHTIKATDEIGVKATATFTVVDMTGPQGQIGQQGSGGELGSFQLLVNVLTTGVSIIALCIATIALLKKKS